MIRLKEAKAIKEYVDTDPNFMQLMENETFKALYEAVKATGVYRLARAWKTSDYISIEIRVDLPGSRNFFPEIYFQNEKNCFEVWVRKVEESISCDQLVEYCNCVSVAKILLQRISTLDFNTLPMKIQNNPEDEVLIVQ